MLILKCKCCFLPYGDTKRHDGNEWNKECFLYILRVFFLILQSSNNNRQDWLPSACEFHSVLLLVVLFLGFQCHLRRVTVFWESAFMVLRYHYRRMQASHIILLSHIKKQQVLKMLKSTSIWHTWEMSLQDYCLFCFHGCFWTCFCLVKCIGDLWRVTLHWKASLVLVLQKCCPAAFLINLCKTSNLNFFQLCFYYQEQYICFMAMKHLSRFSSRTTVTNTKAL